jgi:hypothetical protein
LGRPADLVGGLTQIAIGDEKDGFLRMLFHRGNGGDKRLGEGQSSQA